MGRGVKFCHLLYSLKEHYMRRKCGTLHTLFNYDKINIPFDWYELPVKKAMMRDWIVTILF